MISPRFDIGADGTATINLWLSSLVEMELLNLDAGALEFLLDSDFSNTVTFRGLEVYDAAGNLLPDAIVTGSDGTRYSTLGSPVQSVPEPASLTSLGAGLTAIASLARRRRR